MIFCEKWGQNSWALQGQGLIDRRPVAPVRFLEWNGRDDAGQVLASGSYLIRIKTDFESQTQKVMLLK
jgi:hypothetical protein